MRVTLPRAALQAAMDAIAGAVAKDGATIPIAEFVHVATYDKQQQLRLIGNNLALEAEYSVDADVAEQGLCTLPGRKLRQIARALPARADVDIAFDAAAQTATLKAGRSRFTLNTLPADDFPRFDAMKAEAARFTAHTKTLLTLLQSVGHAQAANDVRYYLNGILLQAAPNGITAVATDGHRLSEARCINAVTDTQDVAKAIIPSHAVTEVLRLLRSIDEDFVMLLIDDDSAQLEAQQQRITFKLLVGNYPDYLKTIPDIDSCRHAPIDDLGELDLALKQAAILCDPRGVRQATVLSLSESRMDLKIDAADKGKVETSVPIDYSDAETFAGVHVPYLQEAVATLDAGMPAHLYMIDTGSPILLLQDIEADYPINLRHVVMPMRI